MPILDTLENGYIRQKLGILHGVGVDGTECFYEYSQDLGATRGQFADLSTQKKVCNCDAGARPAVEQYNSGELEVLVTESEAVVCYVSRDRGETWAQVTAP